MELFYAYKVSDGFAFLDAEESGHCVRVLRHRVGDAVEVIDGSGSLLHCELSDASQKEAVARVVSETPGWGAHPYHLTMAVCPTKNIDRYEWFVEKATELGVDEIVPVIGDHSERRVVRVDRLRKIAIPRLFTYKRRRYQDRSIRSFFHLLILRIMKCMHLITKMAKK